MLKDIRNQQLKKNGDDLLKHLQSFELDLKFSINLSSFGERKSRFHTPFGKPSTIRERLETAVSFMKNGVCSVETHYPNEVDEDNIELYKEFRKEGLKVCSVAPNISYDMDWEFGALSNPTQSIRKKAVERVVRSLQIARELDAGFSIIWYGADGYENPFGMDLIAARERIACSLAEAMDRVPGVRIALEPKPYEPRGRIFYGFTGESILLAQKVESLLTNDVNRQLIKDGHVLAAINPEVGHVLMGTEDLPHSFSLIMEYGRLVHTHWNSQPLGNYDQDLNVGVISPEQTEACLYLMKMYGYDGYFGLDINPERMPVETAVKNCIDALKSYNDRINSMDHEKILTCSDQPDKHRGMLEAILIRERAKYPDSL